MYDTDAPRRSELVCTFGGLVERRFERGFVPKRKRRRVLRDSL